MSKHHPTCECNECWPVHEQPSERPLSFGGAWAPRAAQERSATPLPSPMQPEQGRSALARFADALFGDITVRALRPGAVFPVEESHSHTLCDEQVDFLNLTLTRERAELLQERRAWVMARKGDPLAGRNRVREIDAEIEMIDSITLKLRRQT